MSSRKMTSTETEGTLECQYNNKSEQSIKHCQNMVDPKTKETPVAMETDNEQTREQLQADITMLKEKLHSTEKTVEKTQSNLKLQQTRTKQLISIWKTHVERNEENLRRQGMERDQQLGEVISQLLFFEGQLKKEQKRIVTLLEEKDTVIQKQQFKIDSLTEQNENLFQMLSEAHGWNKNGVIQEELELPTDTAVYDIALPADPVAAVSPIKDKTSIKSIIRFNTVKDRLRRHKSNLELRNIENTIFEETAEELSLSQENVVYRRTNPRRASRERCKSIAGYPIQNDPGLEGVDITPRSFDDNFTGMQSDLNLTVQNGNSETSSMSNVSHIEYDSVTKLAGEYIATSTHSLLNLTDCSNFSQISNNFKARSVSSSDIRMVPEPNDKNSKKTPLVLSDPQRKSPTEEKTSPVGESNPFKSFKSMLKRRGSKLRKKRSVTLQQGTNSDNKQSVKHPKEGKSKK